MDGRNEKIWDNISLGNISMVVIDVGISRVPDATKKSGFRLAGDVKFDEVAPKCSYITPVPGGVGPMTIASLLKNTLEGVKRNRR